MKKLIFILSVPALFLVACNQKNNSADKANIPVTDTSKMHAVKQSADTSIKDGQHVVRYPNGVIKEKSYYAAGRRQGECQSFYQSGKLWSDDFFDAGVLDGIATSYYENGQKKYDGSYTKGKPSGIWNFYDESGKLTHSKNYGKIDKQSM